MKQFFSVLTALVCCLSAAPAFAQDAVPEEAPPATVHEVEVESNVAVLTPVEKAKLTKAVGYYEADGTFVPVEGGGGSTSISKMHHTVQSLFEKAKGMWKDTGIYGFCMREAPSYVTQGYFNQGGRWVDGHEVKMLFNMPYGVGQLIMIFVCVVLIYLAFVKGFEPLLLFPIGFGGLLSNLPLAGVATPGMMEGGIVSADGLIMSGGTIVPGGFLSYVFQFGIDTGLFPILIFFGVGAMTDFGPLIANPKTLLLGAAAQLGIFTALMGAIVISVLPNGIHFSLAEAASIGIIGGADGPTSIWLTTKLAPDLLGPIAVAAYSYMALVPIIQPPLMRLCTTPEERKIRMPNPREVHKIEKVVFPLVVLLLCGALLPSAIPLLGALMFGNLARECGVVDRLSDTMQNALINIVTILLGLSVGSKLAAEKFVTGQTCGIMILGVIAFGVGTIGGLLIAKLMNVFLKEKINPLIGSAGVSAVPMAARVSQNEASKADPTNFILMNAMGPNVAGVIGSAVAAGLLYRMLGG